MVRSNLLFIHVLSAMGVFAALGIEAFALAQLQRASDGGAARAALAAIGAAQRVFGPSALLLVLSGLYLATVYWHWHGVWIGLGLIGLISVGAVGGLITGRSLSRLRSDLDSPTSITSLVKVHATLRASLVIRAALIVAAVFLMTEKPGPVGSLAALGTALVAALIVSRTGRRADVALASGARQ